MNTQKLLVAAIAMLSLPLAAMPSTLLINFETVPVIATGPSTFGAAGTIQTITVPGVATITGGVVLGDATNFPAQSFATPPNVYGTAGFGSSLSSTLAINFNSAFAVTEVSFPVFNGATSTESYVVNVFNGATMVGTQTLSNLPANTSSGFGVVDLIASNITSVTIAPVLLDASCCSGWDFAVDSIALNESVQQAINGPEPGSVFLLGLGIFALFSIRRFF